MRRFERFSDFTDASAPRYATLIADHYVMDRKYGIVRPNGTPDYLIMLTLKGAGIVSSGDIRVDVRPGTLTIYSPKAPQDYRTAPKPGRWDFLWVHCHAPAHILPLLELPKCDNGLSSLDLSALPLPESRRVTALMQDIVINALKGSNLDLHLAMNLLENALLRIHRAIYKPSSDFAEKMQTYIAEHIRERLTVPELAKTAGLSISRFAHLFKSEIGVAPQIYVENQRMDLAKRILAINGGNVKQAALSAGFSDPLYFSKRFKHAYGVAPSGKSSR